MSAFGEWIRPGLLRVISITLAVPVVCSGCQRTVSASRYRYVMNRTVLPPKERREGEFTVGRYSFDGKLVRRVRARTADLDAYTKANPHRVGIALAYQEGLKAGRRARKAHAGGTLTGWPEPPAAPPGLARVEEKNAWRRGHDRGFRFAPPQGSDDRAIEVTRPAPPGAPRRERAARGQGL